LVTVDGRTLAFSKGDCGFDWADRLCIEYLTVLRGEAMAATFTLSPDSLAVDATADELAVEVLAVLMDALARDARDLLGAP
jgi:hypothetical protein